MKKNYKEPDFQVVYMSGHNIDTISVSGTAEGVHAQSGDRMERESWDAGY